MAAARALQNTPETIIASYAAGSDETSSREITTFFKNYRTQLLTSKTDDTIETGTGRCVRPGEPENLKPREIVQANCERDEGCLYCKNYRVIPDRHDLRKLHSYKAVLIASQHREGLHESAEKKYTDIASKIDQIVATVIATGLISEIDSETIRKKAEKHVDLHPYWQRKIELLIQIGVLR